MASQRITKRVVDGLKVEVSEYAVWDAQLPGFGVRVRPSGSMSYIVVYRAGAGRGGIVPRSVELCEASAAVNDVKRPSRFEQLRVCLFPFRSEQQGRPAGLADVCRLSAAGSLWPLPSWQRRSSAAPWRHHSSV